MSITFFCDKNDTIEAKVYLPIYRKFKNYEAITI